MKHLNRKRKKDDFKNAMLYFCYVIELAFECTYKIKKISLFSKTENFDSKPIINITILNIIVFDKNKYFKTLYYVVIYYLIFFFVQVRLG